MPPKSAKVTKELSLAPVQQPAKEIVRNSVVITESTSTGTTPKPTVRVEIAESRATKALPQPTPAASSREPKVIDSRPAYDVIRVGAAYATGQSPLGANIISTGCQQY